MNTRYMHRASVRFERTMDAAFRTPRYASAIEIPRPSVWKRMVQVIKEILS